MYIKKIALIFYYLVVGVQPILNLPNALYIYALKYTSRSREHNNQVVNFFLSGIMTATLLVAILYGITGKAYLDIFFIILILNIRRIRYQLHTLQPMIIAYLIFTAVGISFALEELAKYSYNWTITKVYSEYWSDGYSLYKGSINGLGYHFYLLLMLMFVNIRKSIVTIFIIIYLIVINISTSYHVKAPVVAYIVSFTLTLMLTNNVKRVLIWTTLNVPLLIVLKVKFWTELSSYLDPKSNGRLAEYFGYYENTGVSVESTFIRVLNLYGIIGLLLLSSWLLVMTIKIIKKVRNDGDRKRGRSILMLYFSMLIMMFFSSDMLLIYIPVVGFSWLIILRYIFVGEI